MEKFGDAPGQLPDSIHVNFFFQYSYIVLKFELIDWMLLLNMDATPPPPKSLPCQPLASVADQKCGDDTVSHVHSLLADFGCGGARPGGHHSQGRPAAVEPKDHRWLPRGQDSGFLLILERWQGISLHSAQEQVSFLCSRCVC